MANVVVHFLLVVSILLLQKATGCREACSPIGLDDSNIIPDSSFTASSELRAQYGANKARFTSDRCWEPNGNSNASDYLQIDLGKVFIICAVATKGNAYTAVSEWTTEYKILTSLDGNTWVAYSDNNNSPKLFPGNTDRSSAVKHDLTTFLLARFIRFIPTKYNTYKALRVEVYSPDKKDFSCSSLPVGVASVAKIPDNSMKSSSQYNTSTPASNGRLGYTGGSSWCAATSDSSPYLQVRLGSPYIICGVATQGDHKSDNWVQTYQIQTSTDGSSFTDYKCNNDIQKFAGNTYGDTVVKNQLYEGAVSEYVRIKPKSIYGTTSCTRTEVYGVQQSTVCSKMSIGVSYASLVPDHRFTASSYFSKDASDKRYIPSSARLRTDKAWEPKTNNPGDWLQIDLGSVMYVCAVATQGNAYPVDEYVKKYKLRISLDNVNWEYYTENNADKEFTGNTDRTTIVTNSLATPTKTKFLRFYPTEFKGYAAMRVDVYGVPTSCSTPFGVERGGSIKDSNMTSSSQSDSAHAASFGRLYGDAWCSNVQANTEYLQVDLDKMVTLTGIATQGDRTMDKWVKTYTLKYSIDGNAWNEYREGQPSVKVFQGNRDNSSIVVRWFTHPVTVTYVRVFPQTWNTRICMRIELFGCTCPSSPIIKSLKNKLLTAKPSSYVDLECNVQEPLIQYIDWYSHDTDVTHLSGGITRTVNSVNSVLRLNYTDANTVFSNYKCSNISLLSSIIVCRKNIVCRAKYLKANSNADSLKSAQVLVNLEKPSALTTPSVGSILSMSAAVNWTQPVLKSSQANIISYVIKYWHQSTTKVIIAASQDKSKSISGLSPCTEYNVSITSYSVLGPGPWSDLKTFRTDSEKPTVAPGNVQAQAKTSQSIRVTWQVPVGIRCPQLGYTVTYTKTSGGGLQTKFVNNGQITSKTLANLKKWTEYSINVWVFNDKGNGPTSSAVVERTLEDVPDAQPQNLAAIAKSPTQIDVSWDPPPADKQNGIIRGYKVSYCKTGQCPSPTVKSMTDTSTTLNGLTMYAEYTIRVLAYTTVGDGPLSETVTVSLEFPDGRNGETQEAKKCSPPTYLYITLVIIGVLMAIIVLLLVYIQHLRNKVKELTRERNYKGKSSQETIVYENASVDNGRPDEGIQMNDITATVSPEYDFIDPLPRHPRQTVDHSGTLNTLSHSSKPLHGSKNISIRPDIHKSSIEQQHEKPLSTQGRDSSLVRAAPKEVVTSYMNPPLQNSSPSKSQGIHNNLVSSETRNPQHIISSPTNADTNSNSSFDKEPSGVYQPLESRQQINDSVYEELNEHTMTKTPLNSGAAFGDPSIYQPLEGDVRTTVYETLKLSNRCDKDKEVNI